jgi:hypothetical protein
MYGKRKKSAFLSASNMVYKGKEVKDLMFRRKKNL